MINDHAGKVIKELFTFYLLKNTDQNNLDSIKDSEFVFDYVHLLYYKRHRINTYSGGLYVDYPDWIINRKKQ